MEKLKPCPFCGKEGELFSHEAPLALGGGTRYMVVCSRCFGRAGNADTRDGPALRWHDRTLRQRHGKRKLFQTGIWIQTGIGRCRTGEVSGRME